MTMQTVMFIAQSSGGNGRCDGHPIGADEVLDFARADSRPSARTLRVIGLSIITHAICGARIKFSNI